MKDYYAILGLDRDASAESIKTAYRRLARELHPDLLIDSTPEQRGDASARMAEINEAYSVLSREGRRREYDAEGTTAALVVEEPAEEEAEPATPGVAARSMRSFDRRAMQSNVVTHFTRELRHEIIARNGFEWKDEPLEGFEWALRANFWSARYTVAARSFPVADRAAAQKLANYAEFAIQKSRSVFRSNFYLFLFPFERISGPEEVYRVCGRFSQKLSARGVHVRIVLLDVTHGRSLPLGPRIRDERFARLLPNSGR